MKNMLKKHIQLLFFHTRIDLPKRDPKFFLHKKKGVLVFGTFFALFSFFCLFLEGAFAEMRYPSPRKRFSSSTEKKEKIFPIIERSHAIQEETSRYSIHVEYPSIGFIRTDADVASWARQRVNFFISGLSHVPKDDPTHFSLYVKYERIQPSLRATSFIFYTVTETGNTLPEHGVVTLSYKNQEGQRLSFDDLFENKEGLFIFLSNYTRSQLSLRYNEKSDYQTRLHGTSPDPVNFSLFALTKEGLVIYFAPSQVMSPLEGTVSVEIPLKKLLQFKPNLTLWGKSSSIRMSRKR